MDKKEQGDQAPYFRGANKVPKTEMFRNRVDNMIAECDLPTDDLHWWAVAHLLHDCPKARAVRFETEDKCPSCKSLMLMSYVHSDFIRVKGENESCGFYCPPCGWGNAGSRTVNP